MAKKREPRKYERREFLKQTGRVGLGAAVYGTAGYFGGRVYKSGRDAYRENIKPYVEGAKEAMDSTKEALEKADEGGKGFGDWIAKTFKGEERYNERIQEREDAKAKKEQERIRKQEAEKMSRRGFFNKYLHLFNEHPVSTGTLTGASLGAMIKTLSLYPKYLDKKKVAILKDEHAEYKEKVNILSAYKERLEKAEEEKDNKIKYLEEEVNKLKNIYEKIDMKADTPKGLEEKVKTDEKALSLSILLSGIILIMGIMIINGFNYTGFFILSQNNIDLSSFLGTIIPFISFTFIIVGIIGLRRIKKTNKRKKRGQKKDN